MKYWQLQKAGEWAVEGITTDDNQVEYELLLVHIRSRLKELMMGFKSLISQSKSYPLLSFKDVQQWIKTDLKFLGADFTFRTFD